MRACVAICPCVHFCSAAARHILYSLKCRVQNRDPKSPRNFNFHPIIATAIYSSITCD